jgi:hypothetical protein
MDDESTRLKKNGNDAYHLYVAAAGSVHTF